MPRIDRSALSQIDLRGVFLLNPENKALLTGDPQKPQIKIWQLVEWAVPAFWLIVGVLLINLMGRAIYGYAQITRAPVEISADYVGRRTHITEDDLRYIVTVAYTVEGIDYEREITVSRAAYERADSGEPVRVFYARDEPEIVVRDLPTPLPVVVAVVMALVWNAPLVIGFRSRIRSRKRRKPQFRRGKLVSAEKVRTWASQRNDSIYLLNIEYRFVSPESGETITDSAHHPREDLRISLKARPLHTTEVLPDFPPLIVIFQSDSRYELL